MSRVGKTARRGEDGFTLFEMLVVLLVVALAASAVGFYRFRASPNVELERLSSELAARLRHVRNRAIAEQRPHAVHPDARRRLILFPGDSRPIQIPQTIAFSASAFTAGARPPPITHLTFHPNGSSTGAIFRFNTQGHSHEVSVNWLTGGVRRSGHRLARDASR